MWLEGQKAVSVVMLVMLEEDPKYRSPAWNYSNGEFSNLKQELEQIEITPERFTLEGRYGPAVYKGITWVGKITGFIEIWKKNPVSGLATCMGDRVVS